MNSRAQGTVPEYGSAFAGETENMRLLNNRKAPECSIAPTGQRQGMIVCLNHTGHNDWLEVLVREVQATVAKARLAEILRDVELGV